MKITGLETIRIEEFGNLLWLQVNTSEGVVGLGETFMHAGTVETYLHDVVAARLIGRDALAIDSISRDLVDYLGFASTGVENRTASRDGVHPAQASGCSLASCRKD